MSKKEERKNIEEVIKELNKKYGAGAVFNGSEKEKFEEVISTGSLGLDIAIGIGGLPKNAGKIVEIYGWESSGKSTLAQSIIGNFQKAGVKCLLVDAEDSLDESYAKNLGIDLEKLLVIQLDEHAGEGAYNKIEELVKTGEIGLVVIDSYNALQPLRIVQGEVGDSTLGMHARMLNQAVMKCNTLAAQYGTLFVFLGQLREKIGVMFGSPETTQGGNALRFYSHLRLKVTRSVTTDNSVMEGKEKIGNKTTIKVEKNKLGPPFKSCSFNIIYSQGIDKVNEIIDIASEYDIIKKWGRTLTYNDIKYEFDDFVDTLSGSEELFNDLKSKINLKLNQK